MSTRTNACDDLDIWGLLSGVLYISETSCLSRASQSRDETAAHFSNSFTVINLTAQNDSQADGYGGSIGRYGIALLCLLPTRKARGKGDSRPLHKHLIGGSSRGRNRTLVLRFVGPAPYRLGYATIIQKKRVAGFEPARRSTTLQPGAAC
jgi:hypothetical protein